MIRVGFILSSLDLRWMGGVNYYKNLLNAIYALPNRQIEPVAFVGIKTPPELLRGFPPVETVRLGALDNWSLSWIFGKLLQRRTEEDSLPVRWIGNMLERRISASMELELNKHGIALLSHSGSLGKNAPIKTLGWIPDFQHRRLPEFFGEKDRAHRDFKFHRICSECDMVLLSSYAAQTDLAQFMPECVEKSRVLQFVPSAMNIEQHAPIEDIREKYGIKGAYFHLPNQFWRHKNHMIVIEALKLLGEGVTVVCTGNTADSRHPEYFNEVMRVVERYGLSERFRILGLVPHSDLVAIMENSVALINPSLFEGWSTTVEESKLLGKTILLSDIDVHIEQAPPLGIYFDPRDAAALAQLLKRVACSEINDMPPSNDEKLNAIRRFSGGYQELVLEVMSK